jgi:hypothetical protein
MLPYLQCEQEKKQFECVPSIEMFYDKEKMCYRGEFNLTKNMYVLNLVNNKSIMTKVGLEFISENGESKKQILDFYQTSNLININIGQNGKLIIRLLTNITFDKNEVIETMYCIPSDLHEKYYPCVSRRDCIYFANF